MTNDVWVAVTVVPGAKAAHIETFNNESAANEYVEYSRENAPEGVTAWVESEQSDVKTEFKP